MLTIHVLPRRLKDFLLTHPLYKSPTIQGRLHSGILFCALIIASATNGVDALGGPRPVAALLNGRDGVRPSQMPSIPLITESLFTVGWTKSDWSMGNLSSAACP